MKPQKPVPCMMRARMERVAIASADHDSEYQPRSIRLRQLQHFLCHEAQDQLLRHRCDTSDRNLAQQTLDVIFLGIAEPAVRSTTAIGLSMTRVVSRDHHPSAKIIAQRHPIQSAGPTPVQCWLCKILYTPIRDVNMHSAATTTTTAASQP